MDAEFKPQTFGKRWIVLLIISISITLRGFNQSCFGPSNNLLAYYFQVEPWQIDWLVIIQSVIFLSVALPLSMLTVRMGYRTLVLSTTLSQAAGFAITSIGLSFRSGFSLVLCGQGLMGFSNIVSWSLPPPTAAIWFGKNEVASAVAVQVVARGVGEAIGAYLPTSLTNDNTTGDELGETWTAMYSSLCGVGVLMFILALVIITDKPEQPPSWAQYKAEKEQQRGGLSEDMLQEISKSAAEFWRVLKILFKDPNFVCVWILFGASNPVLRNNNVLLSSAVNMQFGHTIGNLNWRIGLVLMGAWGMYTIGGFVAGPLISYTQNYQLIVVVGEVFLCVSTLLVFLGIYLLNLNLIYVGVILQGFMVGWCNTSLFELIAEISYPHSTIFVTMISIICMGIFRFIYPLLGRFVMNNVSVSASELFPCLITGICVVISVAIRPTYHRKFANQKEERRALLNSLECDDDD